MFASQYDGGFTSSQLNQSDGATPSPSKSRDGQGIVPLTVKQISQASHSSSDDKSNFVVDGVPITIVKLVGIVSDMNEKNTDVSFVVDDGTGRIGCKRWLNEPIDRKQMAAIDNGMYVLLIGHLKIVKANTEVAVFNVRPVNNFDEVTFHHVECIHQHVLNMKSQKGDLVPQNAAADSSQSTPIKSEANGHHSSPTNQFAVQMSVDGLKDIDQKVLDYLQESSSIAEEKGVHRDDIARHLKLSVDKIMQCISCLEDEGLVYSTIDEFHFKSTA